jgi:hypothetical protein
MSVQVQVDHDRSVLLPFAPSPVIDTKVTNGQTIVRDGFLLDATEDGVVAGAHGQTLENSLPGTTSGHVADQPHNLCGALRLPRIHARNTGQTLAEDLAWARRITASETADCRPQFDRDTLPW